MQAPAESRGRAGRQSRLENTAKAGSKGTDIDPGVLGGIAYDNFAFLRHPVFYIIFNDVADAARNSSPTLVSCARARQFALLEA